MHSGRWRTIIRDVITKYERPIRMIAKPPAAKSKTSGIWERIRYYFADGCDAGRFSLSAVTVRCLRSVYDVHYPRISGSTRRRYLRGFLRVRRSVDASERFGIRRNLEFSRRRGKLRATCRTDGHLLLVIGQIIAARGEMSV